MSLVKSRNVALPPYLANIRRGNLLVFHQPPRQHRDRSADMEDKADETSGACISSPCIQ